MASHMLAQTSYGNYLTQTCVRPEVAEEMTNFFGQFEAVQVSEDDMLAQLESQVMDAELEEAASYLAQLSDEEMEKLNQLVQVRHASADDEEDYL